MPSISTPTHAFRWRTPRSPMQKWGLQLLSQQDRTSLVTQRKRATTPFRPPFLPLAESHVKFRLRVIQPPDLKFGYRLLLRGTPGFSLLAMEDGLAGSTIQTSSPDWRKVRTSSPRPEIIHWPLLGFASMSTDTGHNSTQNDASWTGNVEEMIDL